MEFIGSAHQMGAPHFPGCPYSVRLHKYQLVIVQFEPGNDDYWRHGQSNYVDLYNSAFMEPAEPNAVMPVGW
jgi:hypothetical protein